MPESPSAPTAGTVPRARFVSFYLPQFHPDPVNDAAWGKGFTEWTNVAAARPLFRGHRQPRLPGALGFYDLRVQETRRDQARLARSVGIEAFCYWHYWFEGVRPLGLPLDRLLSEGEPDFPFCLAWANETWSRRWLGEERDVILAQRYSVQDDLDHARWLASALVDRRALRLHDRPVFLVYRPLSLPDPSRTLDVWREEWSRIGCPDPYLIGMGDGSRDLSLLGFDATLVWQPNIYAIRHSGRQDRSTRRLLHNLRLGVRSSSLRIADEQAFRSAQPRMSPRWPSHPTVYVDWDNTPRRGRNGFVVRSDPDSEQFRFALEDAVGDTTRIIADPAKRFVFLNAWNEWAEGNCLEPDCTTGGGRRLSDVAHAAFGPSAH